MSKNSENNYGSVDEVALSQVPALEDCYVTLIPQEFKVIIAPALAPKKSQGGILLADSTQESIGDRYQIGRLVAKAPLAFSSISVDGEEPQIGDMVRYARYAGGEHTDVDGRTYRVMMDKDIIGIYDLEKIAAFKDSAIYAKQQAEEQAKVLSRIPTSSLIMVGGSN